MERLRPFLSVIVPTYHRSDQLRTCLRALLSQTYPHERFEVVIVNDGGTIFGESEIENFRKTFVVRFVTQSHSGPAAARNHGVEHAAGEFLAFTDDDCAPGPHWLHALAARFASHPDYALGGHTINGMPNNPYSTASQLLVDYLYGHCNPDPQCATFFASNNFALPAKGFHAIGGFDVRWRRAAGEDRELCDRWLAHGYRMMYVPQAVVEHLHALTWRAFIRKHFNYGRGAFYFHNTCAGRRHLPLRLEPPSFYLRSLPYPFSQFGPARATEYATLMMGAQAATAAGFFWERHRHQR